jgi:hypothetical protein
MNTRKISRADLLTIIEDVGFGEAVIGGADSEGIVVDGYLNLRNMADRLNTLVELRMRSERALHDSQAR